MEKRSDATLLRSIALSSKIVRDSHYVRAELMVATPNPPAKSLDGQQSSAPSLWQWSGTTFSLASTTDVDAEVAEIIPDADEQLTQSELRWCIFESARLDGEIEELDARLVWEVENYNVRSRAYQEQCSKKKI